MKIAAKAKFAKRTRPDKSVQMTHRGPTLLLFFFFFILLHGLALQLPAIEAGVSSKVPANPSFLLLQVAGKYRGGGRPSRWPVHAPHMYDGCGTPLLLLARQCVSFAKQPIECIPYITHRVCVTGNATQQQVADSLRPALGALFSPSFPLASPTPPTHTPHTRVRPCTTAHARTSYDM